MEMMVMEEEDSRSSNEDSGVGKFDLRSSSAPRRAIVFILAAESLKQILRCRGLGTRGVVFICREKRLASKTGSGFKGGGG